MSFDTSALDGYEAFVATHHDGSVLGCVAAFESRLAQLFDLTDHQYVGFFLANLRPRIRMHMKDPSIKSYSDAVQLALRIKQLSGSQYVGHHLTSSTPSSHRRPIHSTVSSMPTSLKDFSSTASSLSALGQSRTFCRFRNMSSKEYKKHIIKRTYTVVSVFSLR